ncbi:MAG: wax ester/triacylglycerol synthase family O-acyltransferase [Solirubrobacteraceae bacterium]
MTEHLTPLDATFLELEQADESAHMHIGGAMIFDPLPETGGAPTLAQLQASLSGRIGSMPRYQQRLSHPRTGGLRWPDWVADEHFDIAAHVRRAMLPAPGGEEELLEWLSDFYSHRLDRARPLWEIVLLEGLAHGRWALASKTHHCMVDGVGSVQAAHLLLDTSADGAHEEPAAALLDGIGNGNGRQHAFPASLILAGARAGVDAALHPRKLLDALERSRALAELIVRDEMIAAPHTSLNVPMGGHRRMLAVRVPLDDLKAIKRVLGGTVNDVALTACTSGLRRLFEARGEEPPSEGLRAMVPMNIRDASGHLELGNPIWSIFATLPVAEPTVFRRHERTVAETEELKQGRMPKGAGTLIDLAGLAPPVLHSTIARALFATRLFNVTITNVPGPAQRLYAFGAPMREVIPMVPLAAEHALGVAIFSYDGGVVFGIVADRETVPELDVMAAGIEEAVAELLAMARGLAAV